MPVYIDDMYTISLGQFGRMKMSHMMADTTEELLEMVDKIGVQRKWIQKAGTTQEHFDIAMGKRKLAIQNGAIEVSMRVLAPWAVHGRKFNLLERIQQDKQINSD